MGILNALAFIFFFSSHRGTNQQASTSCHRGTTVADDLDQDSQACDHVIASGESDNCSYRDDD